MATRTKTGDDNSANVRTRLPLLQQWSVIVPNGPRGAAEITVIWSTTAQWKRAKLDPSEWAVLPLRGFLIALRFTR